MGSKKLILVIGATGTQGKAVVKSLLAPRDDGTLSPYSVRAFTRNPTGKPAQLLASWGVEVVKGRVEDMDSVIAALQGCYGVFVNTSSWDLGKKEIYVAINIFEAAKIARINHYIWSMIDYANKLGSFSPKYRGALMANGKGAVGDYMRSQSTSPTGDAFSWSIITTGPYLETLRDIFLGPLPERENGAVVWALPIGDGLIPTISLDDIGWWARYTFDHRSETCGQELKVASEMITLDQLVETFTRVTGIPAVHKRLSVEEWRALYPGLDKPLLKSEPDGYTFADAYTGAYLMWQDKLIQRDMEWVRQVHPNAWTLERFIREKGIDGTLDRGLADNYHKIRASL